MLLITAVIVFVPKRKIFHRSLRNGTGEDQFVVYQDCWKGWSVNRLTKWTSLQGQENFHLLSNALVNSLVTMFPIFEKLNVIFSLTRISKRSRGS